MRSEDLGSESLYYLLLYWDSYLKGHKYTSPLVLKQYHNVKAKISQVFVETRKVVPYL